MNNSENQTAWQRFTNFDRSPVYSFFLDYGRKRKVAAHLRNEEYDAIKEMGKEAFPQLIKLLYDGDSGMRSRAVHMLGELMYESSITDLVRKLEDKDVRDAAISALAEIGLPAVPALKYVLNSTSKSKDWTVRSSAVAALGKMNDAGVIPILADAMLMDSDACVRAEAAKAIGSISHVASLPLYGNPLGETAKEVRVKALLRALHDRADIVRIVAEQSVSSCANESTAYLFVNALRNPNLARVWDIAGKMLIKIGESAVPVIDTLLNHPDWDVRANAAMLLGEIRSGKAIPRLVFMLKDPHRYVRENAAESLGKIGALAAVPNLVEALTDNKENVRAKALEALESIASRCSTQEHCEVMLDALNAGERSVKSCSGKKKGIDITISVARLKCAVTEKLNEHEQMRKESEELACERFTKMIFKPAQSFKIENRQLKRAVNG